ncbi:MAG TPA: histidine phosphatase family protein [Myxococcales bacterium]|jgi:phosphohistidine phosphatase SixA
MDLYIVRHGIPVDTSDWDGDDSTRPLTDHGEAQAEAFFERLKKHGDIDRLQRVLTSPYARAQRTAEIAGEVLGAPVEAIVELSSSTSPALVLRTLENRRELPERLMLVGHNPDLPMLIGALTGEPSLSHGLDRCGAVRLEGRLEPGAMRVVWRKAPGAA